MAVTTVTKRRLGNSDLEITAIGLGAWAIRCGGWAYDQGYQSDPEAIAAPHRLMVSYAAASTTWERTN